MKGVTTAQLRKIHICARECGMDDELLHVSIQNITGKTSLKELSALEACRVIDLLEGKRCGDPQEETVTPKQMQYIRWLMKQLGWINSQNKPDMTKLDELCKTIINIDSYMWLSKVGGIKIIALLKEMVADRKEAD